MKTGFHAALTDDGLELQALLFEPERKTKTVVLHFHGKEGNFVQNHFLFTMNKEYTAAGYAFMTANHRGHDYMADVLKKSAAGWEYSQQGSAFDIFENCVYDIKCWADYLENLGFENIVLQQHSTPQKIVWYQHNTRNPRVKAMLLLSPADIGYLFRAYVKDADKNLALAEKMVSAGKGRELMPVNLWSNCPVSAATYANWYGKKSNFLMFDYSNPEKKFKELSEIKLPLFFAAGEKDFALPSNVAECLEIIKSRAASSPLTETYLSAGAPHSYEGKAAELSKKAISFLKKSGI
ncbi:MAG: DUF1749 domain-containing protein [Candidatus Diapherotrites archaeon]